MTTETQTAETTVSTPDAAVEGQVAPTTESQAAAPSTEQPAPGATAAPEGEQKPVEGVVPTTPEEYADFVAPEGIQFDATLTTELKTIAHKYQLPQEAAQEIADLGAKAAQTQAELYAGKAEALKGEWREASAADKEFGGDALAENVAVANKALQTFGSPELNAMLKETGLGNHPEVIRAFYKVGKSISEDKLIPGGVRPPGAADQAKTLFPNMN